MNKQWKINLNFPSYKISDNGDVYSFITNRMMKLRPNRKGYLAVSLINSDGCKKSVLVHRIVAETFLGTPDDKQLQVNHKDGVKDNNDVDNLEWCTCAENIKHACRLGLKGIVVSQYNCNGNYMNTFSSIEAAIKATDASRSGIYTTCQGLLRQSGGYQWKFGKNESDIGKIAKFNIKNRPVGQFDTKDNLIAVYSSAQNAERITGIKQYNISRVCHRKRNIAKGYIWKFMDNIE